ncbi:MAG: hypothetical protein EOQ28_22740 [Mesorhizobium sp.]|nr:MAG: hypothetical protein EOQ28_22740 [Mesorhizobium sp.]RWB98509.1 MAG: hypothetical protein EOQ57_22130 [Mesorhizobium sp.]RWK02967.1 MAG: hypothetical protein EOR42_19940 [Mesorhizobium sp.]
MLVVVTYDEIGGFWDQVAPPRADRWGPGNRVPAFVVSPYARMGTVDHTQYDLDPALHHRPLRPAGAQGIVARDKVPAANGEPDDLTAAIDLTK